MHAEVILKEPPAMGAPHPSGWERVGGGSWASVAQQMEGANPEFCPPSSIDSIMHNAFKVVL